ncbi:MAG: hypothetical protein IJD13_00455 [Oscillospiraceae bacterium]|nr:hypothetical protein [Oscillospiraceae bacterium]
MADKNKNDNQTSWLPIGLCLGMGIGVTFGAALDNLSLGMTLGPCFGLLLGAVLDSRNKKNK